MAFPRTSGCSRARLASLAALAEPARSRTDRADFVFAFHDDEEIGPRMLARIAKRTGLRPDRPIIDDWSGLLIGGG